MTLSRLAAGEGHGFHDVAPSKPCWGVSIPKATGSHLCILIWEESSLNFHLDCMEESGLDVRLETEAPAVLGW